MLSAEDVVAIALKQWNENTTKAQRVTLLTLPIVSGTLSAIGSTLILWMLAKRGDVKRRMPDRLLCAMSALDVLVSLSHVFGAFAVPKETGATLARGTWATCELAGFMTNMNYAVGIYNVGLLFYSLMRTRYRWVESKISKKFEIPIHALAFAFPLATGTAGVVRNAFNPLPAGLRRCYSSLYPPRCFNIPGVECERGHHSQHWYLSYAPTSALIVCFLVLLLMISWSTFAVYQKSRRWEFSGGFDQEAGTSSRSLRRTANTKAMIHQSILYGSFFFLTNVWGIVLPIWATLTNKPRPPLIMTYLFEFFIPLQGCCNFVNYARPRFLRIRYYRRNDKSIIWAMKETILGPPMDSSRYKSRGGGRWHRGRLSDGQKNTSSSEVGPASLVPQEQPGDEFDSPGGRASHHRRHGIRVRMDVAGSPATDEAYQRPRQDFRSTEFTLRLTPLGKGRDTVFEGDFEDGISDSSASSPAGDDGGENPAQRGSEDDEEGGTASGKSSRSYSLSNGGSEHPSATTSQRNAASTMDEEAQDTSIFHQEAIECQPQLNNDTLVSRRGSGEEIIFELLALEQGPRLVQSNQNFSRTSLESVRDDEEQSHEAPEVISLANTDDDVTIDA